MQREGESTHRPANAMQLCNFADKLHLVARAVWTLFFIAAVDVRYRVTRNIAARHRPCKLAFNVKQKIKNKKRRHKSRRSDRKLKTETINSPGMCDSSELWEKREYIKRSQVEGEGRGRSHRPVLACECVQKQRCISLRRGTRRINNDVISRDIAAICGGLATMRLYNSAQIAIKPPRRTPCTRNRRDGDARISDGKDNRTHRTRGGELLFPELWRKGKKRERGSYLNRVTDRLAHEKTVPTTFPGGFER